MTVNEFIELYDFLLNEKEVKTQDDLNDIENYCSLNYSREEHAKLAEGYIIELIEKMAPITLLTNLGLISLGESLGLINFEMRIQQFQLDFIMALVLKYGKMKKSYQKTSNYDEILLILKLSSIYNFVFEHSLHNNNLHAKNINSYYRMRKTEFTPEKLKMIKMLFIKYDSKINSSQIKMEKVIELILAYDKLISKRLSYLSGQVIDLNKQYRFFMVSADELVKFSKEQNVDLSLIYEVISYFTCKVGDFREIAIEELCLNNPINEKFVLALNQGVYFIPNAGILLKNLMNICEKIIANSATNFNTYNKIKADFLEDKLYNIIYNKFKGEGQVFINSQWQDGRNGENDCLLIYENYAIIFEAKAGNINKNVRKGLINAARNDEKKLISKASEQARDFAAYLRNKQGTRVDLKVKGRSNNHIDLTNTDKILTVGVTLIESPLQNMRLNNQKHIPIISIFQLDKIFSILSTYEIIDYIEKRNVIEETINYVGEELDYLYSYLLSGLNSDKRLYMPSESKELNLIYYKEGEVQISDRERTEMFANILDKNYKNKGDAWLDKQVSILGITPLVQKQIEREIKKKNTLELFDSNIPSRRKVIFVEKLEYFDMDTEEEVEEKIFEFHKQFSDEVNELLYFGLDDDLNCRILKLLKGSNIY